MGFWGVALLGLFVAPLFFIQPFIQNEVVGQAHYWTVSDVSFWFTLFDPWRLGEGGTGRFRYLEYLTQAGYWNMMKQGWLPKTLLDLSALLLTLFIAVGLDQFAKRKGLNHWQRMLCLALFVLSVPTFMVIAFHYRKAKVIASLWLAFLFLEAHRKSPRRNIIGALGFLGCLTDPSFILLAPAITIAFDRQQKSKWINTKALGVGYVLAAICVLLLNGIIGPLVNENCALFSGMPNKAGRHLNPLNLFLTSEIFPDLFGPLMFGHVSTYFGILCLVGVVALGYLFRAGLSPTTMSFFLALPICAIITLPNSREGVFGTYYGHMLWTIFCFASVEWLSQGTPFRSKFSQATLLGCLVAILGLHQVSKFRLFDLEKRKHTLTQEKFDKDLKELTQLKRHLKDNTEPYRWDIDLKNAPPHNGEQFHHLFTDQVPNQRRTTLAYFLMPVLYHREILDKKILISDYSE